MSEVSGYFLVLNEQRKAVFENRDDDTFGEPVPEFEHSRNVPLICFVLDEKGMMSYVGLGSRGQMAGTNLRKLKVKEIHKLDKSLSVTEIIQETDARAKSHLIEPAERGGRIPPKSLESFLEVLLEKLPELKAKFEKFTSARRVRIEKLSDAEKQSLAEQKEAIITALNIAGIDKSVMQGWDYKESIGAKSYLDGLENVRVMEDSMIVNDLANFPGYDLIRLGTHSTAYFENGDIRLTITLANKQPLELQTGTDLIYYNENFHCYALIQYKVMEKESDKFVYRVPNIQLTEEIKRMDAISELLKPIKNDGSLKDYRISGQPFFIKLCQRIDFHPDDIGLSKGMYVPLDYFKLLQVDESVKGTRGGMAITFQNVGRHLDNTHFKSIIEGGWIGTYKNQSSVLREIIKSTLESGKALVLARKETIITPESSSHRNISTDIFGSIDESSHDDDLSD